MEVRLVDKLQRFGKKHSDSRARLLSWCNVISDAAFGTPRELLAAFPQVDYVKPYFVFNIGREYRLIALVQFDRQVVYIRHVLTHREYDRGKWKEA